MTAARTLYKVFHGFDPEWEATGTLWVPGDMYDVGRCIDVGYLVDTKASNKKRATYVHDCGPKVRVYSRTGNGKRKTWKRFPSDLWALGYWTGLTLDQDGHKKEVKGGRSAYLCTNSSGSLLVVLHKTKGVFYVVQGGSLRVTDWIRG
jgi:hypothetical protein